MFKILARVFAISVLPTPVGPTNNKLATGLLSSLSPALDSFIALTTSFIPSTYPNSWYSSSSSSFPNFSTSSISTVCFGILQILDKTSSIRLLSTV